MDSCKRSGIEGKALEYFESFLRYFGDRDKRYFRGVKTSEIPVLEKIADVNINIYSHTKSAENGGIIGQQIRRSLGIHSDTCNLLQVGKHVCYITNMTAFFQRYKCLTCSKFFTKSGNMLRHMRRDCTESVRNVYPGKVYNLSQTMFEKLEELGIVVEQKDRLFSHFAIFDFETYCSREELLKPTNTMDYQGKHIPISVSVCNNFVSTDPSFIHNADPQQLVTDFVNYLERLSEMSANMQLDRYALVIRALKDLQYALFESLKGKFY